jgi:hypothetical protein
VAGAIAGIMAAFSALGEKIFKLEGKKVNDLRDAFFAAAGGFAALHQKLIDANAEGAWQQLWNARTVKDWEAGVAAAEAALGKYNAELERTKGIQAEIDALQQKLDDYPNWEQMQEAAQKYGIDLANLGPAFQSARLHQMATELWNDFELLTRGGADVGSVLDGMSPKITELVRQSIQFGTTIPEQFRPLIEKLIESGGLVDANGNKITDMSGIQFGAPLVSEVDKIVQAIKELIETLRTGAVPAIQGIGRGLDDTDWEGYRDRGVRALEDIEAAADGAALGHSPGGVREIATQLAIVDSLTTGMAGPLSGLFNGLYGSSLTASGGISALGAAIAALPDRLPGYIDGGGFDKLPDKKKAPGLPDLGSLLAGMSWSGSGLAGTGTDMISMKAAEEQVQALWRLYGQGSASPGQLNMLASKMGVSGSAYVSGSALSDFLRTLEAAATKAGYTPGRADQAFATGGIVTRPTRALIGEAGPEAVVPLGRLGDTSRLEDRLASIEDLLSAQPRAIARAVRDAMALA